MRTADDMYTMSELKPLLPEAYFAALACPLAEKLEKLVDARGALSDDTLRLVNMAP